MNPLLRRDATRRRAIALLVGTLGLGAVVSGLAHGSESHLVGGEEAPLFGTTVSTWARIDAKGRVLQAGVTIPFAAIENAPAGHRTGAFKADAVVRFPAEVRETTFLDHLGLFWEPEGHEPTGRYDVPHFDFHFFNVPPDRAAAIDCTNLERRDPKLTPAGWVPPVPPGADPREFCVPLMGFHLIPESEFNGPGVFKPGRFDKVMIAGEYEGKFSFLEPMVTKAELEKRRTFSLPVPQPVHLGHATLYPTKFEARFDRAANAYELILSGFEPVS
jgi:Domain of unknown function (DUF5602)